MKNIFLDKTIIVTGGASGIGAALVEKLHGLGAKLFIIDRAELKYEGPATYVQADMSNVVQAEKVFTQLFQELESVDYVINGAGIFMAGEIGQTPIRDWHTVIDNNIYAVSHGAYLAYQYMQGRKTGHIINISSTAGLIPVPFMGVYGATKYAIVGLSHAMRIEGSRFGVKVSVACPTIVDTPLYDTAIYNGFDKQRILRSRTKLQTADAAATMILRGIRKNQATIHTSFITWCMWEVYKFAPRLYGVAAKKFMRRKH